MSLLVHQNIDSLCVYICDAGPFLMIIHKKRRTVRNNPLRNKRKNFAGTCFGLWSLHRFPMKFVSYALYIEKDNVILVIKFDKRDIFTSII